jgi:hypothetical protein
MFWRSSGDHKIGIHYSNCQFDLGEIHHSLRSNKVAVLLTFLAACGLGPTGEQRLEGCKNSILVFCIPDSIKQKRRRIGMRLLD